MKTRISLQHFKDFDIRFFFLLFLLPSLLQQRVAVDESPGEVEGRNTQCPYRVIDGVRVVLPFENDKTTKQRAPRQPVTREKGNSSSFGCCCFFFPMRGKCTLRHAPFTVAEAKDKFLSSPIQYAEPQENPTQRALTQNKSVSPNQLFLTVHVSQVNGKQGPRVTGIIALGYFQVGQLD